MFLNIHTRAEADQHEKNQYELNFFQWGNFKVMIVNLYEKEKNLVVRVKG